MGKEQFGSGCSGRTLGLVIELFIDADIFETMGTGNRQITALF